MKLIYFIPVCLALLAFKNNERNTWQIVDNANKPVPYANVFIKGSNTGTTSNATGEFTVSISNTADTVTISCLGYITRNIVARELIKSDKIVLTEAVHTLNEVVVRSVDLDKFLVTTMHTFESSFQQNQEANIYLRTYQKVNEDYIGFAEASGLQFFSNCTIDNPKIKTSSWQTYFEVRIFGFSNKTHTEQAPQVGFLPFINHHLKQMFPFESHLYSKKIVDEYIQNGENIWVIEMEPLYEHRKRLNFLDRRVAYYLDYFNVTKRYYITEKTKRLLGIDIISNKDEVRRRNEERKYINRNEIIRFTYVNNKCFLSYAKQDVTMKNSSNTSQEPIKEILELFYDNFKVATYGLKELEKKYFLRDIETKNGFYFSGTPSTYFTGHPYPYFPGKGNVNNESFWSKQVLPPYNYENMKKKILPK